MKWYHFIACLFAGAFLANAVPHFVNGVSGNAFPSPFSDPPGIGLSPPMINVAWAFFNIIIGYLLFRAGKIRHSNKVGILLFFIGALAMSMMIGNHFAGKMAG
jgi:hypothetical protein